MKRNRRPDYDRSMGIAEAEFMTQLGRRVLLAAGAVVLASSNVNGAGQVGDGTPNSCTESALNAALVGGGLVTFACGPAPVNITVTTEIVIAVPTTIDGAGLVRLIGSGSNRFFRLPGGPSPGVTFTIRGVDLYGGRCPIVGPETSLGGAVWAGAGSQVTVADAHFFGNGCVAPGVGMGGGVVHIQGGSLLLQRVQGLGNEAPLGGEVHAVDSTVTIEDSVFVSNSNSERGTVLYVQGASGAVFRRSTVSGAIASVTGGAIHAEFAPGAAGLLVEDSLVAGGWVLAGSGGGVYQSGGPLTITGSLFTGNRAGEGGAVYAADVSPLVVSNSTFVTNHAFELSPNDGGNGGALFLAGATTGSVSHTTLVDNQAAGTGGAVAGNGTTPVVLRASILLGNSSGSGARFSPSCGLVLAPGGFDIQAPADQDADCTPGILRAPPGLDGIADNGGPTTTFALLPGSPARDLVTSGCPPPSVDQRGQPRPIGPACDAGSFEWSPVVTIDDVFTLEGTSGAVPAAFTVRLSAASLQTVTVAYATADQGGATAGADYVATGGVLTFLPGETTHQVVVSVLGDLLQEGSEAYEVRLGPTVGGRIGRGTGIGYITDDDFPPVITLEGCETAEGTASGSTCRFTVTLNWYSGFPVTVSYATSDLTATAGSDYQASTGTFAIPPGALTGTIDVPILPDAVDETTEFFRMSLSAPQHGTIGVGQAAGTIRDDDGPTISIADAAFAEGAIGPHPEDVTVTLSGPSPEEITVGYGTAAGTATQNVDYSQSGGTITFAPGQTTGTARVYLLGDLEDEPNERFFVGLSPPQGGSLADEQAVVTILDDDGGTLTALGLDRGSEVRRALTSGPDLFVLPQPPYTSWEVVLDEASGDLGASGPTLERLRGSTTVAQSSVAVGVGPARSLRWVDLDGANHEDYVRVSSAGCGTDCGPDDVYRLRVHETTLRAPRFNCAGNLASVVLVQNTTNAMVSVNIMAWSADGVLLAQDDTLFTPFRVYPWPVCAFAPGQAGSITVVHDGPYGAIAGKVVTVDPSTGMSFDTPLQSAPE